MFQEMKEIWLGKAEDGKAPSCQEGGMQNVLHTSTNAGVHKLHMRFSICNKNQRGELFMSAATVFGIKVPPGQKNQILYDAVEIALSKTQSAKADSSADELPWLRERQ